VNEVTTAPIDTLSDDDVTDGSDVMEDDDVENTDAGGDENVDVPDVAV
jgi:hypothetical protein